MAHRRHRPVTSTGTPIHLAGAGSSGDPDVLFLHATGFCKEVWRPVVASLDEQRPATRSLALDLRGHGDSPRGEPPYRWDQLTDDVILTLGQHSGVVGVGHSCGGAVIARAAALVPSLFSAMILIEPIILPPPYRRENIPLARAAQRRRNRFASRDAAYERFLSGPMETWQPEALAAYVDFGFVDDGDGVAIKCEPAVEADMFREGWNHDTWDLVPDISVPVTIASGELSETHTPPFLDALHSQFNDPTMVVVPETGHFLPMERPDVVASLIVGALDNESP
ncbi:MAG: alpha/beta hydrolase [Actinomycetota bacterium]